MMKRSQIPSQQIISFRFSFIKLPVVWEVLTEARREKFKTQLFKECVAGRRWQRRPGEMAAFEEWLPVAPLLWGRMRRIQTLESEVLSEITDLQSIRDEFFALPENDPERLAAFLNRVGAWPSSNDPASRNSPGHGLMFPLVVQPSEVWAFRADLRDALLDKNRQWFKENVTPVSSKPKTWIDLFPRQPANEFPLRFELSGVVAGIVPLTNARHMLFATALADVAQGIHFKLCARKGCGVPFPIKSEHLKKVKRFHDTKCEHRALVQRGREEEKKKRRAEKPRARKSLQ